MMNLGVLEVTQTAVFPQLKASSVCLAACSTERKLEDSGPHRQSKSDIHSLNKVDHRPRSGCSAVKTPVTGEDIGDRRMSTPRNDVVGDVGPVTDDVEGDVIDARKRHLSTSLEASLTTDVVDEEDVDDDNEDQDDDMKKRKKTRTVFSRHQVTFVSKL